MATMQRVLVVDDDEDTRELIEEVLHACCVVTLAEDGADALDVLDSDRRERLVRRAWVRRRPD